MVNHPINLIQNRILVLTAGVIEKYLCAVGVKIAFNVSLTIPPHLSRLAARKTDAENQRITLLRVKNGLLLFDGKALRVFAP